MRTDDLPEPALVYDAKERRTHSEHAAEAYDIAGRAQARGTITREVSQDAMVLAQWHATMAVYELLALEGRVIA